MRTRLLWAGARMLLALGVLAVAESTAQPRLTTPPTVTIAANRCTVTLSAPDVPATGGWRVQFYRDSQIAVGARDNASPFTVTRNDIPAGNHAFYYVASTTTQTLEPSAATATVRCELAETPPPPRPCEVTWIDNWVTSATGICRPNGTQTITEQRIAVLEPTGCQPIPPVLPSETREREQSCTYVPPVTGGVLAPADFTYDGMIKLPQPQLGGAGRLTAITTSTGALQSFISAAGEIAYEYGIPTTPPNRSYAQAPTAPLLRQIGYFFWNRVAGGPPCDVSDASGCWQDGRNSYEYPSGTRRNPQLFNVHGFVWVAGRLWWTLLDFYNTDFGATDHVLGVTDLSQSETSGWVKPTYRVANSNVKLLGGSITKNPNGSLGLVGSFGAISRNTDNSHGPCWSTFNAPSSAGGFNSPALNVNTTLCYSISSKAPRGPDYIPDYANPYNPDRAPANGVGYWTQVDRMDVAVWIETTGGKRGLLFLGGLGTGQIWYGHYSAGPNGAVDPCQSSTRGENAQGYRPEWRIYDPASLKPGHNDAVHTFDPQTHAQIPWADWWFPCKNYASGAYFDQATSKLYVLAASVLHRWSVRP